MIDARARARAIAAEVRVEEDRHAILDIEGEREGVGRTAIAYNAAISACEKGMVPQKACEVFQR